MKLIIFQHINMLGLNEEEQLIADIAIGVLEAVAVYKELKS